MIGQSVAKWDASPKTDGRFRYPSDLSMNAMLHVKVLRANRPHAEVVSIDTSAASTLNGVVCVLTHRDVPGTNAFGLIAADQPVLCSSRVRFAGDAVAIVAAETEAIARSALGLINVEYVDLPVVLDPREALEPDAPAIHAEGNLCHRVNMGFGDAGDALSSSAHISRISYSTGRQEHAYLEPEAGISFIDEKDRIAVICGGQNPFADQRQLASILGVPAEKVWVSHPPMGGAFGGKEDLNVQAPVALVTNATGRPARMVYDRAESIAHSVKRHRFEVAVEVGADAEGNLTGFRARMLADTGAYLTLGPGVMVLAAEHVSGPYRFRASEIRGDVVYTNTGNASAFRGFGNPQAILGIEQAMDELALRLNMDPIDFRCRNLLRPGDQAGAGHILKTELSFDAMVSQVRNSKLLCAEQNTPPNQRATGIAFVWQGFGLGSGAEHGSTVKIIRNMDGTFTLNLSQPDLGEGNLTAFLQIASDQLGCDVTDVRLDHGSTDHANAWSTNASRSVAVTGSAVLLAAQAMRKRVDSGENGALEEEAFFTPEMDAPIEIGAPHVGYACGVQIINLSIDATTGAVTLHEVETHLDPGTVINPDGVTGQIEGGLAQGIGYALSEELALEDGIVLNDRLSSYILPTIRDMPARVRTILTPSTEVSNPVGARGIAEIGITPVAAAVANAVAQIAGSRFTEFPVLPEHIIEKVEAVL